MNNPKYSDIEVPLSGEDGNIFYIMGRTTKAMRRAGIDSNEIDAFVNELMATESYDAALQCVMRWVATS